MSDSIKQIVRRITFHPRTRQELFASLSPTMRGDVFERLSPRIQNAIINRLHDDDVVALLDQLDPRNARVALARIDNPQRRNTILVRLKGEIAEKASWFVRFHPKAAASLVSLNYILVPHDSKVRDVTHAIEAHHADTGRIPEILVHNDGILHGEVSLTVLMNRPRTGLVGPLATHVATVAYTTTAEDIVATLSDSRHNKVVVLDADGSVVGVVYSDDALSLFENDPAASLYDFAGVDEGERPFDPIMSKVRNRYRWLVINLFTAFFAAAVVGLFENTLSQLVILAAYMPIVAGMGGNAATQTLAVMVRGIAMGDIHLRDALPAVYRETAAGVINGIITGAIVLVIAWLWNGEPLLGVVVTIALIFNLIVAGFFGTTIPLIMKRFGKDPATSATIFITTATDVLGFFAFLGLATLVLL